MTITLRLSDILGSSIMAIAATLILIQQDETGYLLVWDFHGLLYATIILSILPFYHTALIIHGLCQIAVDMLD